MTKAAPASAICQLADGSIDDLAPPGPAFTCRGRSLASRSAGTRGAPKGAARP